MPRRPRVQPGGYVFHVLNRGNGRMRLFDDDGDYAAFERCLAEALEAVPVRLLAYCLMPNHWHLVLYPRAGGDLGRFMATLTTTHVRRWHVNRHSVGGGHVYQGTYKSFPVQSDEHFLSVARYVERNAPRAKLCKRAEDWRWCSLWRRRPKLTDAGEVDGLTLSAWPVPEPAHWLRTVNAAQSEKELEALRRCVNRGQPLGSERWVKRVTKELGLESTFRGRGRPRKAGAGR